jgi:ATP-binding cassette, subfamily C (CFTR/MRP), member 1
MRFEDGWISADFGTVTTVVSGALAPSVEPATVSWNSAVQKRVGHVSEMLGQVKGVKMMGLIDFFHTLLRGLRLDEIKASERLRWLVVYLTTLGMLFRSPKLALYS